MKRRYAAQYWIIPAYFLLIGTFLFSSCSTVKVSRYARYNQFEYTGGQPSFHFSNDSLGIFGNWHYYSGNRAVPHPSYFPKPIHNLLRGYSRQHGPVLFSTWSPDSKRYSVKGYVPVTRKDVRTKRRYYPPSYLTVLVNDRPFPSDISALEDRGRNRDYQFQVFAAPPEQVFDTLRVTKVFAVGKERYYTFIAIGSRRLSADTGFFSTRNWHLPLFVEDVKRMVTEKEEEEEIELQ